MVGTVKTAEHLEWDVGLRLLAHDVLNTWARRIAVMSLERMGDEWVGLCLFQLVEALRWDFC